MPGILFGNANRFQEKDSKAGLLAPQNVGQCQVNPTLNFSSHVPVSQKLDHRTRDGPFTYCHFAPLFLFEGEAVWCGGWRSLFQRQLLGDRDKRVFGSDSCDRDRGLRP